jgi:hypothetical protein
MVDTESPYRPPAAPEIGSADCIPGKGSGFAVAGFVALPFIGGFIGFAGYIAAASILEAHDDWSGPRLSYGQQAGLISLPICTMIGAAIGLGFAFAIVRRYMVSIALLLLVSLCGWCIVNVMWNDQIARYGRDPSEVVLYYPPMAFSMLALAAAFIVGLVAAVRWRARVT